ncbi:MAG: redoxin domain-containing protein [Ruminococcaceae bacterium]|nr:redoxin domain-containing protein [Oscillospiraceae bacterium]
MKQQKTLLIVLLVFALLLVGAYFLYDNLKDRVDTDSLFANATQGSQPGQTQDSQPEQTQDSQPGQTQDRQPEQTQDSQPEQTQDTQPGQTQDTQPEQNQTQEETQSNQAPDFTVYDGQGNPVKLSDFRGKPVVLNFWASWCPPCKAEMPHFEAVSKEMAGQVQFLMVNATGGRETLASAMDFVAKSDYTFPVFYDTDGMASYIYQVYSLPSTYFIDAKGNLVTYAIGMISQEKLEQNIQKIMEKGSA